MNSVTPLRRRPPRDPKDDKWLRRQGVQIAAQLPENREDALAVLAHARAVVRRFLAPSKRA